MDRTRFRPAHRPPPRRDEDALWLAFKGGKLLVTTDEGRVGLPHVQDLSALGLSASDEIYLGTLDGTHCFAAKLTDVNDLPAGASLRKMRPLFDELATELVALAGRAAQLLNWHQTHRYCRACGSSLIDQEDERAKICLACGLTCFPRISPAVIVAVLKKDAILLARGPRFKDGLFSVLAGFVEPGETLEEAVRREVREEVGLEIANVRYFGSQPWPFPDSLMIAFLAEHAGGEIRIDGREIVEAGWYTPGGLPLIPSHASIARRLIDWFCATHAGA